MEERYNLTGDQRQTDEFMKPIILNKEGLVKGSVTAGCPLWSGLVP